MISTDSSLSVQGEGGGGGGASRVGYFLLLGIQRPTHSLLIGYPIQASRPAARLQTYHRQANRLILCCLILLINLVLPKQRWAFNAGLHR